ncbi:hypothetical protein [Actinosynnema sp. NPDC023587]|uniref:hypothetical protein n=1 Tax=Actinosynnema sp. NPDC023587 TaxID=3154695 RepID=UPI00340F2E1E
MAAHLGCHGEILDDGTGERVLITADTGDTDDALPTAKLARRILKGTNIRHLLLMLDTCYSGCGGNELTAAALTRYWTAEDAAGLVVMSSTQPADQAEVGVFPMLLRAVVAAESTAGHAPPSLALDALADAMHTPGQAGIPARRHELEPRASRQGRPHQDRAHRSEA